MNSARRRARVPLTIVLVFAAALSPSIPRVRSFRQQQKAITDSSPAKREEAYRENNLGVALLEQYKAKEAAESFNRALEIKPDLLIVRINLSIALYYLPDAEGAKREAARALTQDASAPQPHFILGLIARAQNRLE